MSTPDHPEIPGWAYHSRAYHRSLPDGRRGVVSCPDGWNWGYLVLDARGRVLEGRVASDLDPWRAVELADAALGTPV